ncbi:NAD-dependent epimerase/dehydratase family protein [Alteromonas ponticola]|uniref:NAD-dependent epimerase/dehydratase family protein n=1 Tax=Alteromonas ponticola TaxID=2720613 RepID=A0ABX1R8H9_9ALTE|nr:NAD-dependent epimerase/dehydratase family protein [Alteromonas ponticola]NMH61447.1 NAD-dependent epimerase/dehydratase family protein [Alteromonas ponticola]
MTQSVTLCGCGWLGNYLLKALAGNYAVLGTTRHSNRAEQIKHNGASVLFFQLGDDPAQLCQQSENARVVLNIPPGRRNQDLTEYTRQMCALIDSFVAHEARQIIFISTTSVYGENERVVTEHSELIPLTASAKAHCAIENHLRRLANEKATVVRLAGLVGPDRHPAKSLSGKQLSQANKVVNLVHIDDVVAALKKVIDHGAPAQTLHLCSQAHPTRQDYYTWCAEKMGIPVPEFDGEDKQLKGKQIDASASWQYLGLTPRYASPFDMII